MTDNEGTAIRLAEKLANLTSAGKLTWTDAGKLGPWGNWPGQVFKASVEARTFAQIAEVPLPNSAINSYYFGVAEGKPEIFEINIHDSPKEIFGIFAEGFPAAPSEEKLHLYNSLRSLYLAARDSAFGTRKKVERFEEVLERLA